MSKSTNPAERVRFGTFELSVRTGELVSIGTAAAEAGSAKVLLREQPFQILRVLVERHGSIVTRQEIRQILWPNDTVVEFDRSINVAMAILRKALADDADHPKYIETLARRGYRLIAPIEWQQSSTAAQDLLEPRGQTLPGIEGQISEREPRAPKPWRKVGALGTCAVILIVVGYLSWRHFRDATPAGPKKVLLAVLPFTFRLNWGTETGSPPISVISTRQVTSLRWDYYLEIQTKEADLDSRMTIDCLLRADAERVRLTAQLR